MVRFPTAQPLPRVPRSRRDDLFEKGHPLCAKRGGIGIVMSREGDTATVLISEELISGCIPLTEMPPVGAVVEVEARCDLMVILDWSDGVPQPILGEWYFTPAESPNWAEADKTDAPMGVGLEITNAAPEGPGILWNRADFDVCTGDVLKFTGLFSQLLPSTPATAQLVFCWAEHGDDPQPSNGEVVAYGDPLTVAAEILEFAATATVPADFDKPPGGGSRSPTGRARIGLQFTMAGGA